MIFSTFGGIAPAVPRLSRDPTTAVIAQDVDLTSGVIRPWRTNVRVSGVVGNTLVIFNQQFFAFDSCVVATTYMPSCCFMLMTGRTCDLEAMEVVDGEPVFTAISPPTPNTPVASSTVTTIDETVDRTSYVVSYVNKFGMEGPLSYPSNTVLISDEGTVTIAGWTAPDAKYGVTHIRIYRSATGERTGAETTQEALTGYLHVATISATNTSFVDTVPRIRLGSVASTLNNRQAPDNLQCITLLPDTETLAGFVGNKVYFSENAEPHNWPLKYELTLDYPIVRLGTYAHMLVATTTGGAYVIDGAQSDVRVTCREVGKVNSLPDISCSRAHGGVSTLSDFFYSSPDGVVCITTPIRGFGSTPGVPPSRVVTVGLFTSMQWRSIQSETARFAYHHGQLVISTDTHTFMLAIGEKSSLLTTLTDRPIDVCSSNLDHLFFLNGDGVYEFDAGDSYREYLWVSSSINPLLFTKTNTAIAPPTTCAITMPYTNRHTTEALFIRFYDQPNDLLEYCDIVSVNVPDGAFRIPRMRRGGMTNFGLRGTGFVDGAALGVSFNNLYEG